MPSNQRQIHDLGERLRRQMTQLESASVAFDELPG